jgi:hypothetical protein
MGQIEAEKKVQQLTTELAAAKSNTSAEQDKASTEELDIQREAEKAAAIEKAVAEATEKLRVELAANDNKESAASEDINALRASHEQEIKKLTEEHATKLVEAKSEAGTGAASEEALKAAREDGVSAGKKELASKLTLLERKLQTKDASIATLSARNAELEQLLKASNSTTPVLTAIPPAATTEAKIAPKRSGSVSNGTAASNAPNSANSAHLPGKPAAVEGAGAGRGSVPVRGAARGAAPARGTGATRGAAARGRGRGGMTGGSVLDGVNAVLGAAAATNTTSGGTSIAGAAKRPRESEGGATAEGGSDLAKRLRSADAANAAAKSGETGTNTVTTAAPTRTLPPRNRQPPSTTQ